MLDKLKLTKIYDSFESEEINIDINKIKSNIAKIDDLLNQIFNCEVLESYLFLSNEISLLLNKLYSFSYLNLYLDTGNAKAINLNERILKLELNFKNSEFYFSKLLTKNLIDKFACKSKYIFAHKTYLYQLIESDRKIPFYKYNLNYEQNYHKKISEKIISIKNKNYPVNLTLHDLFNDEKYKSINKDYINLRNTFFKENGNFFCDIFLNIKKETINMASALGYKTPLSMSLSSSYFTSDNLNKLIYSIEKNKFIFSDFLNNKSNTTTNNAQKYTIVEIKKIILDSFSTFDYSLLEKAANIFNNDYINLDNNKNKIIGSCHIKILSLKESRIIGHYTGTIKDIFQIAHEIGHSYQNSFIMNSQTPINSNVPTSTCEIVSSFCELLVLDNLLKNSINQEQKKMVLKYFINYIIQAVLDVYARFLFESKVFELMSKTDFSISFDKLNTLMIDSQEKAYSNNNKYFDEYLWIYKPHFYSISIPYYNYSYSFGLLYAILLFNIYKEIGSEKFYIKFKHFCEQSSSVNINKLSELYNINLDNFQCFDSSFNFIKNLINDLLN